jgi:hypothetical protein
VIGVDQRLLSRLVFAACGTCGQWWRTEAAEGIARAHTVETGHPTDVSFTSSIRFEAVPS